MNILETLASRAEMSVPLKTRNVDVSYSYNVAFSETVQIPENFEVKDITMRWSTVTFISTTDQEYTVDLRDEVADIEYKRPDTLEWKESTTLQNEGELL